MLHLRKFTVAKNSMDNKGGIKIFRRSSFVSLCRKLSQGNPSVLCLRKIQVAKTSMDNKGGIRTFRRKVFVSLCRKTFARKLFCAMFQKISESEKLFG